MDTKSGDEDLRYNDNYKRILDPYSSKMVKIKLPENESEPAKITPPPKAAPRPKT